jgi:hypothetical protein
MDKTPVVCYYYKNKIKENTGVTAYFLQLISTIHRKYSIQIEQTEISLCIFVF